METLNAWAGELVCLAFMAVGFLGYMAMLYRRECKKEDEADRLEREVVRLKHELESAQAASNYWQQQMADRGTTAQETLEEIASHLHGSVSRRDVQCAALAAISELRRYGLYFLTPIKIELVADPPEDAPQSDTSGKASDQAMGPKKVSTPRRKGAKKTGK